jgi:hypothetical protein
MISNEVLIVALCCCTPSDLHQLIVRAPQKPDDQTLTNMLTQMGVSQLSQTALLQSSFFDHVFTNKAAFAGVAQVVARPELSYDDPPCPPLTKVSAIVKALPPQ